MTSDTNSNNTNNNNNNNNNDNNDNNNNNNNNNNSDYPVVLKFRVAVRRGVALPHGQKGLFSLG